MADDYFDDTSDADFLAIAGNLDSNGTAATSSARSIGGTSARPVADRPVAPGRSTSSASATGRRSETPRTAQTPPRVARPGFNAIIVNTRQVILQLRRELILER
jgi:hypothetical protein